MNEVFANRSDEDEIYPLTAVEIAEAQRADASPEQLFKRNEVNWSRIGDQAHWEHNLCLKRWLASYPQATPGACSQMVSPLPTAPWTHTSQRDDECCNVLERYAYHHPVNNKVLQILRD